MTVIRDGAVGLCAALSAKQLGAERIILLGRHTDRTDLGRKFGATDVVAERGEAGVERVRELTVGDGTHTVLEAVGHLPAMEQALGVVRAGGTISRVGAPQYDQVPMGFPSFLRNVTLTGGVAPARAYIDRLLPGVLTAPCIPAGSSTAPSTSPTPRRATARWASAPRSRSCSSPDRHSRTAPLPRHPESAPRCPAAPAPTMSATPP